MGEEREEIVEVDRLAHFILLQFVEIGGDHLQVFFSFFFHFFFYFLLCCDYCLL